MSNDINIVDLAFIVDTTGSMGSLIEAARRQMITIINELTKAASINLRLGIVEYRDHPPQDKMVYQVYAFTDTMKKAQKTLQGLQAEGGGDAPEAVLDGIVAACRELQWHKHARRLAVLVGDAPPHGVGAQGDKFQKGCPCGETIETVTRIAEETRVTIYSLGLTGDVNASFGAISHLTGGTFFPSGQADTAIQHLASILKKEFEHLDLDRRILALWQKNPDITNDELVEQTDSSRHTVSASLVRLLSRDLIKAPTWV